MPVFAIQRIAFVLTRNALERCVVYIFLAKSEKWMEIQTNNEKGV